MSIGRRMSDRPFDKERVLPLLDQGFRKMVPYNDALGLTAIDCAPGMCVLKLPWAEHLVGNSETGVLHGGVITSLLDACGGASVFLALPSPIPIATLDLRIDYLKMASPRRDVIARTECYKLGRNVAFVRGVAYHDTPDDPIASCAATFMLSTKGKPVVTRGGS
ncbi:MAG: PaaI family thioesterase [Deltaproteobacteria bacterium]|nr:PaaI family thioesterase [Deltaproteobacteria bacterium]